MTRAQAHNPAFLFPKPLGARSRRRLLAPAGLFVILALVSWMAPLESAFAIPPYARQTGLQCTACHTIYPQLTEFGRQFKLNGYTQGNDTKLYERIGAWVQGSYTHTAKAQPGGAAPGYGDNDNFALDQASLFFGGKIAGKVGAFVQGTYDGIGKEFVWDNVDIRYANSTMTDGNPITYGISINNNPGVQDLWNSTPVWGFPFDGSGLAPGPSAGTLIDGGLGQVAMGATVYALWNNSVYSEVGLYRILSRGIIDALAGGSDGVPTSSGVAPYWRFAWQQASGTDAVEVGTFGMHAALFPDADRSAGADAYTDIGLDAQYQHTAGNSDITARASFVQEYQLLNASLALGGADQRHNKLRTVKADVTWTLDQTWGLTGGLNHIWGNPDAAFYGTPSGSPDSTSFILEGDWLPLNKTPLSAYPWFDPKFSVQYVHYAKLDGSSSNVDGSGRSASDDDTLFLLLTLTM